MSGLWSLEGIAEEAVQQTTLLEQKLFQTKKIKLTYKFPSHKDSLLCNVSLKLANSVPGDYFKNKGVSAFSLV